MSGGQFVRIELFAARGLRSFCVEARNSMRCNLCLGCISIRRERGMLLRDRHAPQIPNLPKNSQHDQHTSNGLVSRSYHQLCPHAFCNSI